MPEITRITSEALQATIRRLLPSQQGFGDDLEASNVITPVIDLTPTAEGSVLPSYLQTALAFGSQSPFSVNSETSTLINTTGFYRVIGTVQVNYASATGNFAGFRLTDGLSTKIIWGNDYGNGLNDTESAVPFDFVVFLATGESLTATSSDGNSHIYGSTRQIADVNGNLVNPSGFTSE